MKVLLGTTLLLASLSAFAHDPVYNGRKSTYCKEHA